MRSSALIEDGANESMAGAFLSLQHVNGASPGDVTDAITRVMQSMTGNPQDQVLVQPMIEDIAVNGVIMTYDMVHGTPYYCIDFDDERQDRHHHRRQRHQQGAFVYRHAEPGLLRSPRILRFLQLAKELESLCACLALDIEFGLDRTGKLYLFQVRRMARPDTGIPLPNAASPDSWSSSSALSRNAPCLVKAWSASGRFWPSCPIGIQRS